MIKVFCNICEQEIKGIDADKVTGKEICKDCGKKIESAFSEVSAAIKGFQIELGNMHEEMKKKYRTLDATYAAFNTQATDLWTRTKADLEELKRNIARKDEM